MADRVRAASGSFDFLKLMASSILNLLGDSYDFSTGLTDLARDDSTFEIIELAVEPYLSGDL